ncbi:MAG: PQQ-binding-like beta-propeller repeat protein [Actinomycetota bacterium]|nr:PQQ-like beta-propeller repeat protein [Actinomycetota bacterium]
MIAHDSDHGSFVANGPGAPLRLKWRAEPPSSERFTTWPIAVGGTVIASSGFGVLAVDASVGRKRWYSEFPEGQIIASPASDGKVAYVPLDKGIVAALNIGTGNTEWKVDLHGQVNSSPVLSGNHLCMAMSKPEVVCLKSNSGAVDWTTTTSFIPDSSPAVASGILIVPTNDPTSEQGLLLALDVNSGSPLWQVEQKENNSSPSILDDKVVFGGGDLFAYAVDLKTGKQIWKSPVEGKFGPQNSPAVAYGDVFLADRIGNIYRLDGKTGKRKWIFRDTIGTFDQSFPVVAGKTLYIGSGAGWLYGVDVDTGHLVWKYHLGGFILSGAADDKHFYFGVKFSHEGLYAFEHDPNSKRISKATPNIVGSVLLVFLVIGAFIVAMVLMNRKPRSP